MSEQDNQRKPLIAVVGGGIAGLYCCLQLSKLKPKVNITLYESTSRLGGRIETWRIRKVNNAKTPAVVRSIHLPELATENSKYQAKKLTERLPDMFVAEFGPMRIEPDQQPYLKKLLDDLEICPPKDGEKEAWSDLIPFPSYQAEAPKQPSFMLEGEEAEQTTLIDLLLLALRHIFEIVSVERDEHSSTTGDPTNTPWMLLKKGSSTQLKPEYTEYKEANFYWAEFRKDHELNRRYWKGFLQNWIDLLEDQHYDVIRERFQFRGRYLYNMGFWNLLGSVLSHMAVVKLRDWGSFYHLLPENPNAAEWIIFWLRAIKSSDSLQGIRGGMDWIVFRLCQELGFVTKDNNKLTSMGKDQLSYAPEMDLKLQLDHQLLGVCQRENGKVSLRFMNNGVERAEIEADHVILALPKAPLEEIDFKCEDATSLNELRWNLDAVFSFPLLKCFFIVDKPFWEDNRKPNTYADHVPTRELHWWKNRDKTLGMTMIYTDRPGTQFWTDYLTKQQVEKKSRLQFKAEVWNWGEENSTEYDRKLEKFENERLLRTFLLYARENSSEYVTASRLIAAGMRDWGLKPFGGACHAWRSGSQSRIVRKYLSSISLLGSGPGPIHICGEAYSDYQGFIEGALRSAKEALIALPFKITEKQLLPEGHEERALPRSREPN
jgi:monoamine oxidase